METRGPPLDPPFTIFCTPIISIILSSNRVPIPEKRALPTQARKSPPLPERYYNYSWSTREATFSSSSLDFMDKLVSEAFGNPMAAITSSFLISRSLRLGYSLDQHKSIQDVPFSFQLSVLKLCKSEYSNIKRVTHIRP